MADNTNLENVNVETEVVDGADTNTATTETEVDTKDTVTMSKAEYDKALQSEGDKVRGRMSKEIKELKEKIKELTPVEKTPEQIELEDRIAKLEENERAVADKQRRLDIQEQLSNKGLDKSLIDYIKDDADIDTLAEVIENMVKSKAKSNGYQPGEHSSDDKISMEDYQKMTYHERAELAKNSPELYRRLTGRK